VVDSDDDLLEPPIDADEIGPAKPPLEKRDEFGPPILDESEVGEGVPAPPGVRRWRMQDPAVSPVLGRIDYARDLNPQQLAAVEAGDGPILVLAGAGSGKTRVITYRVAWLIEHGVRPSRILLATFTNKAAHNMLSRVEHLLGAPLKGMLGGTFHHVANVLLRQYGSVLGYTSEFTILDEADAERLMKQVRREADIEAEKKLFPSARVLHSIASSLVNSSMTLSQAMVVRFPQFSRLIDKIQAIITNYQARKREHNLMDFDDLLLNLWRVMKEYPTTAAAIGSRFRYVLVDEYQDTNTIQAELVDMLSSVHKNVFVVGDDAQSIYSFRGANYTNILRFPERFPDCKIYKLETNYRSVPAILDFANDLLKGQPEHFRKRLAPVKGGKWRPTVVAVDDASAQAEFVALRILELREKEGVGLDDIGVLYRAHSNSQEIEFELRKRGIPYFIRGGMRFLEQAHIKDILSYLVVLANSRDMVAWERILAHCDRVGDKTVAGVIGDLRKVDAPLEAFIHDGVRERGTSAGRASLGRLASLLGKASAQSGSIEPAALLRKILDDYYDEYLKNTYDNYDDRRQDIEQLIMYASKYSTLTDFLTDIALAGGFASDEIARGILENADEGKVTLSTIHQAKGLEWRVVFVVWCVDGVIPHQMCFASDDEMEEERRLFYVAITRAEQELYLVYPQRRQVGEFLSVLAKLSRFISEIERRLYDEMRVEIVNEPDEEKPG
jgi:DNA helicase-2/ATP-dependent DNA helicase PcrA